MLSFHVKTDGQTNRQTTEKQYAPDLSIRGHKKLVTSIFFLSHHDSILDSLPNDKILNMTKLKAFADNKSNVTKMISLLDRVENIVGKRENAGYRHFLLYLQCFPKPSS